MNLKIEIIVNSLRENSKVKSLNNSELSDYIKSKFKCSTYIAKIACNILKNYN